MKKTFMGGEFPQKSKNGNGKRGFYIALVLLVMAIGISGYYINRVRNGDESDAMVSVVQNSPLIQATPIPTVTPQPTKVSEKTSVKPNKAKEKPTAKTDAEEKRPIVAVAKVSKPQFSYPVDGKPILEYSPDKLIYSKTFDDWRTHNGIDLAAPRGAQVKAVWNGLIEKVYRDDKLGITIVINHGDFQSLYGGLSTDSMVKIGQQVKRSEIISGVGASPAGESALEPHLHFELLEGGKPVNPSKYLAYANTNELEKEEN